MQAHTTRTTTTLEILYMEPPPAHKGGAYLGIMPGSVNEVLRRLERTKTNRTADTTGMAEQESWVS